MHSVSMLLSGVPAERRRLGEAPAWGPQRRIDRRQMHLSLAFMPIILMKFPSTVELIYISNLIFLKVRVIYF